MIHQILVCLAAVFAVTFAFPGLPHAGLAYGGHYDHYAYPKYHFNYGVADGHTGDLKNQWEARDGGVTKGSYSLKEVDRAIHRSYVTDNHHGFNVVGHAVHAHPVYTYGIHHGGYGYY